MTGVFADSWYFLALLNADDRGHHRAVEITTSIAKPMVTTTWVLTEVADALCKPPHRNRALNFIRELQSDPGVIMVNPTIELFNAGLDLYGRRPDKEWSLTDCVSFAVMADRNQTEALTADRHFEQAGFRALLKDAKD